MAVLEPYVGSYYLWDYVPSTAAASIFGILFAVATIAHIYRIVTTKAKFCIPFVLGCFFEVIGYCGRVYAHNKTGKLMPYIIQNFFILVAPALFAASIYMTLGRIIRSVKGERYSVIRTSRLTKTFVCGDILSFWIQGGSSGLMFQPSLVKYGQAMVVVGLMLQIIMFGLFAITAVLFENRIKRNPTSESHNNVVPWKQSLKMLYAISALIMVRSIFRAVEFIMGNSGYLLSYEWTLYVFDSLLMIIVTVIFYVRYPSELTQINVDDAVLLASQSPRGSKA